VTIAYYEIGDLKKNLPPPQHYTRDAVLVGLAQPDLAGVPKFIKMSQRKRVELRVILQADGCIGPIIVLEGAKDRESYAALMGAIRSRFLPAQTDGRPVDSAARIYYQFGGY
jgi:hypothetical protein